MSKARADAWSSLQGPWDLIVVGGGITGAGILREATAAGLRALLVEQRDFAWGTSSRSSKLVHGGLRYLAQGQLRLTWESVREREHLLKDGPGLVEPIDFLLATYSGERPGRWSYAAGLAIYDMLAGCWRHEYFARDDFKQIAPDLDDTRLTGGFRYHDASTDDARLVLRVLHEAIADGGTAVNYAEAVEVIRERDAVVGVRVRDVSGEHPELECRARAVVNATGAWADRLRSQLDVEARMRPLRGSHLVFPADRLPITQAIGMLHPVDRRAMFVFPWEGVTVVGTTDIDHQAPLDVEPSITPAEVAYLMQAVEARFPSRKLTLDDVVATYSGVRPVVNTGKAHPSQETREHVIWQERGLLTVTGGKLTTFRLIAREALAAIRRQLAAPAAPQDRPILSPVTEETLTGTPGLSSEERHRLLGRHGELTPALIAGSRPGELARIDGTPFLWAELRWAARTEWVLHLDDLLLRRVRLGLLLPGGGADLLPRVREICQPELGWSNARWAAEEDAYRERCKKNYGLPDRAAIPDWRAQRRDS